MTDAMRQRALLRFLRAPEKATQEFDVQDWDDLLRCARRANLLSRVACLMHGSPAMEVWPERLKLHLRSAWRVAKNSDRLVHLEVDRIHQALSSQGIAFALLKGAAYIVGRLPPGPGRMLSDIDIMVSRERLEEAERALVQHGWMTTKLDAYDQRYYRTWMHELPPMRHLDRGTSLDVHHTILPPTAQLKPDVKKLWQGMLDVPGFSACKMLGQADLVLHSACHLFHDGELEQGLRDLVDMDAMLRVFGQQPGFWARLVARGQEMDLALPLYYALRYGARLLETPVPPQAMQQAVLAGQPNRAMSAVMDFLIERSLGSVLEHEVSLTTQVCQFFIYVRSHYLRMPLRLLLPHLLRKQFARDSSG